MMEIYFNEYLQQWKSKSDILRYICERLVKEDPDLTIKIMIEANEKMQHMQEEINKLKEIQAKEEWAEFNNE